VQWEQDVSGSAHFVFGDNVVVAVSYVQTQASDVEEFPPQFEALSGYDIDTGEQLWTRSIADWEMKHGWETVEMAADTVVFLQAGEITGLDAATGELMWQADYELMAAEDDGWVQPPSLAAIDGSLYLAENDGSVAVFDLASGATTSEFDLPASMQDLNPIIIQLFEVPAGLLVVADTYSGPGALTKLYMVDPENGDLLWERSLDHSGLIDVATDGSIAIATHTWESPPLLLRLIGQEGHSTSALIWLSADGDMLLETDRVELPNMGGLVVAGNGELICGTTEEFTCFDREGTRYTLDVTFAWDAVWIGDTLLILTDRGVMRVELP
jgi:outer membrane protein assembly factor BamB